MLTTLIQSLNPDDTSNINWVHGKLHFYSKQPGFKYAFNTALNIHRHLPFMHHNFSLAHFDVKLV